MVAGTKCGKVVNKLFFRFDSQTLRRFISCFSEYLEGSLDHLVVGIQRDLEGSLDTLMVP